MKTANLLFIFWLKSFSFNGNFYSSSMEHGMRMSELSEVLWNFAYAKYVFYFLPGVPSKAANQVSITFLKLQHHSLSLWLKVWTIDISNMWKPIRNTEFWAWHRTYWLRICILSRSLDNEIHLKVWAARKQYDNQRTTLLRC